CHCVLHLCFFFYATAPTMSYTLSLHDALPISPAHGVAAPLSACVADRLPPAAYRGARLDSSGRLEPLPGLGDLLPRGEDLDLHRSEEHTSELQSRENLVCRLLLEKKKKNQKHI